VAALRRPHLRVCEYLLQGLVEVETAAGGSVGGAPIQFTDRIAGEGAFAAFGHGSLWIANAADDEVVRIASRR
jgi:hypothetical protein